MVLVLCTSSDCAIIFIKFRESISKVAELFTKQDRQTDGYTYIHTYIHTYIQKNTFYR